MAKTETKYLISYKNILSKFEKETIPNIILFGLKEKVLLDDLIEIICNKFLGKNFDKNNLISFNGEDRAIENILNECSNTGLFSDRKVVVVKNVKKLLKDEKMSLIDYFKRPNPDTILIMISGDEEFSPGKIFLYDGKSVNESAREVQTIVEKNVKIFEVSNFTETEITDWIRIKFEDYKIDDKALSQFLQFSNYSPDEILSEIEKLKTYCYTDKEVTLEAVNLCNGIAKDFNENDFIKAVIEKKYEHALKIYDKISLKKDVEVFLIFLLNSAFIVINKLYDPAISKYQGFLLKKELKLWSDEQFNMLPNFQKYRDKVAQEKMKTAFEFIFSTDKILKSTGSDKRTVMIKLIDNICKL